MKKTTKKTVDPVRSLRAKLAIAQAHIMNAVAKVERLRADEVIATSENTRLWNEVTRLSAVLSKERQAKDDAVRACQSLHLDIQRNQAEFDAWMKKNAKEREEEAQRYTIAAERLNRINQEDREYFQGIIAKMKLYSDQLRSQMEPARFKCDALGIPRAVA